MFSKLFTFDVHIFTVLVSTEILEVFRHLFLYVNMHSELAVFTISCAGVHVRLLTVNDISWPPYSLRYSKIIYSLCVEFTLYLNRYVICYVQLFYPYVLK